MKFRNSLKAFSALALSFVMLAGLFVPALAEGKCLLSTDQNQEELEFYPSTSVRIKKEDKLTLPSNGKSNTYVAPPKSSLQQVAEEAKKEEAESPKAEVTSQSSFNPFANVTSGFKSEVAKLKAKNQDVVGWLRIPNTKINEPVVYSSNNLNYLRRDVYGKWDYFGAYFSDMDNKSLKNGTREDLDKNTIIYGHNVYWGIKTPKFWQGHKMPEIPTENLGVDYKGGEKFAQLYNYTDQEFAKTHPYIYYTTDKEEMVFEVFAAYYTDLKFRFNSKNSLTYSDDMLRIVKESKAKSVFDFNVPVDEDDKIITLSTCSYIEGPRSEDVRFNVSARLCKKDEKQKTEATITKNPKRMGYRKTLGIV